ncbi:MAG: nucleotidyl transferase AbiEii/AbiGii toxin family protein [bacterium]
MISSEIIKELAVKHQTTELNVVREYFQHLFLYYFYIQKPSSKVLFKGGTALRVIYASPRFSEDLDFSTEIKSISTLEDLVLEALSEMEREGLSGKIRESKATSGGYLSIIYFEFGNRKITIQIEVSLRNKGIKGETVTIASDFIPPYTLEQLLQEDLVDEKIKALFSRQKPRDFYDLYFMLRANLIPTQKKSLMTKTLKILQNTKIPFAKELKVFLPQSHWAVIKTFKESLEREIHRNFSF